MGHALNGSVQDTLMRYHRMLGQRSKWILGTDHAGIATQAQVEKLLKSEGTSRQELGREKFVERVWEWREHYGGTIIEQFKRLGATTDYADENFTLDPGYAEAVAKVFVELYERGWIYRDNYMVNWDPGTRSAISDLEVEDREETDTLYSIDYPLLSGSGAITIATVRPETMLGDTRGRRPSRRRALRAPGRRARGAAADRPQAEDHRRPLRQAGVRHGRAEDHARRTTRTTSRSAASTAWRRSR